MATSQVYGVRETLKEIKAIDEKLYFACVKQIKDVTTPLSDAISASFPANAPMSGMANRGRLGYKKPKVTSKFGGRKDKNKDEWGLVKIIVWGANAQMIDTAANPDNTGKAYYKVNGTARSHKKNGQGDQMIRNLNSYGSPSRFVWPTANKMLPMISAQVLQAIEDVSKIVNKNLVLRNK